ncbi:acetylxylan esterase [Candidatus Sumerlaeota bacterium]|nr:acetylxylan esterase [Candidatus Sumerlaeota bacterium]
MNIKKSLDKITARERLWSLLGDLPPQREITSRKIFEEETKYYKLEKIILDLNGVEPVPAFFVKPKYPKGPFPAILYSHVHGGEYTKGKEELIEGWRSLQKPPYAEEFAKRGWAALAIDCWNFGERNSRAESALFKEMLWKGQVLWGMMVFDSIRALDYLCSREDVDSNRIGALGMSMGSALSWWVAALDERISVCVDICCLTDFQALMETNGLDKHGLYYYVPGLLKHFTTARINELIVPRRHLSLAGLKDPLTPVSGLDVIDEYLKKAYEREGAPDFWKLIREESGHEETPRMRSEILSLLEKAWGQST